MYIALIVISAANCKKRANLNGPSASFIRPSSSFEAFNVHVVTGVDLMGEISTFRTIMLPIDIHWLDFERALSDTTANTRQAAEAGFPCGYEVVHGCGSRGHYWLWIFKVPGQMVTIRTPYRKLSNAAEFTELRSVYNYEKVLKKQPLWEQDLKQAMGLANREMDSSMTGLVVLHVCLISSQILFPHL